MSSLICVSLSSAFRPFDARKYRENWQLNNLNQIRKSIVNYGQPHIVLLWHSGSSFCSPITASKLCTRECKLPATFIFRQMCNVQLHSNFSMQWHFQISLCPALSGYLLFLTNCTKQSHFTKLLCRNVLRSAKFKSIFFSSFHCIKINQNSNVHKIRYYFKIVIDFYMLP